MLATLALLFAQPSGIATVDALAQTRNAAGLAEISDGLSADHFGYLRNPGAFGTGRFGWRAQLLEDVVTDDAYAVMTTPLTIQDYGEQIYVLNNGRLTSYIGEEDRRGVKPRHYNIHVTVNPDAAVQFVAKVDFRMDGVRRPSFFTRLSPHYKVSAVRDSMGRPVPFSQTGGVVNLPMPMAADFTYTFEYAGKPSLRGFAGMITADELMLTDDYWWPSVGRYPATTAVTADVPEGWQVISNGNRTAQETAAGRTVAKFENPLAISYLSFSAAKFEATRRPGDIIQVVWATSMSADDRTLQSELQEDVIKFFGSYITPWPFKGYTSVISDLYGGGALEGYSYATYATGWLPDNDPHEPSHTYFGGVIPNTYLRSFWNESFATYCEDLYERETAIGNQDERRLAFIPNMTPSPIYEQGTVASAGVMQGRVASALGYGKGGLVLYMLEQEIGREKMQAAIRRWLLEHPRGDAGEWEQFEKIVGEEYKWFFDQWIRRPGFPKMDIRNVRYADGALTGEVAFTGPAYRLTVDVLIEDPLGNRGLHRVQVVPEEGASVARFGLLLPEEPVAASFDPYDRLMVARSTPRPASLRQRLSQMSAIVNPNTREWIRTADFGAARITDQIPANPNGMVLVGHPKDWPSMTVLCERAGFHVDGNLLTYDGTTIDLTKGAAAAIVEYEPGVTIGIVLGQTRRMLDTGLASFALVDEYGRLVRGGVEPRTEGEWVFRF